MIVDRKSGSGGAAGAAWPRRLAVVSAMLLAPCWAAWGTVSTGPFPEPVLESLKSAFTVYDEVRGELAADRLDGLPVSAERLAAALRASLEDRGDLAAETADVIEEAARAADSLTESADLEAARLVFGDVSRRLVRLGDTDPRLTEGWYVFACPMAEGFERWIQSTQTMANPYMGPSMLLCGSASDWSVPPPAPATRQARSADEPEFKPGIAGLRMEDVRDKRFLWREIEELQMWELGDRITIAEFRSKAIEKTAHYLGFRGTAAEEFAATAADVVDGVRASFHRQRASGQDPSGRESQFSSDLAAAVERMNSLLEGEPRHQLFEPDVKKWLYKLAFGPKESEEAEEARQARADDGSGGQGSGSGAH